MISLVSSLPRMDSDSAEMIKINCLYDCYKGDDKVLFWCQDGERAVISMTDGNMIIFNNGADTDELCGFVNMMSPACVYSDYETLCRIGKKPQERINVMSCDAEIDGETRSDSLSSKEIYDLLDVEGLSLPEYPYFAVDYCRRLNHGGADYFGLKGKCAVITFHSQSKAIINGIASKEKGYGGRALTAALQINKGRRLFVCCRDKVKGFYQKHGFKQLYYAGYWVREN